eukprot:Sspe_Gene.93438::Locus_66078_Transcript_3_8_Confidence_0.286_Length_1285::g.93438::m.93438
MVSHEDHMRILHPRPWNTLLSLSLSHTPQCVQGLVVSPTQHRTPRECSTREMPQPPLASTRLLLLAVLLASCKGFLDAELTRDECARVPTLPACRATLCSIEGVRVHIATKGKEVYSAVCHPPMSHEQCERAISRNPLLPALRALISAEVAVCRCFSTVTPTVPAEGSGGTTECGEDLTACYLSPTGCLDRFLRTFPTSRNQSTPSLTSGNTAPCPHYRCAKQVSNARGLLIAAVLLDRTLSGCVRDWQDCLFSTHVCMEATCQALPSSLPPPPPNCSAIAVSEYCNYVVAAAPRFAALPLAALIALLLLL